jgi:exoribonuclease R
MNKQVGVLYLSSSISHITNGKIQKVFKPFCYGCDIILINTKKTSKFDMYVLIDSTNNTVIEYIGEIGDIELDKKMLEMCIRCNHLNKINKEFIKISQIDLTPNRAIVLDKLQIYTIDPPECKDFDDALGCIKNNSGYIVYVMIADPSSFIEEGSKYDLELSKRAETSYYNSENPIHMIPEDLSIEFMSLKEQQQKRAFEVKIIFDNNLNIVNVQFQKVFVSVTKNLTYDIANCMVEQSECITLLYDIGKKLHYEYLKQTTKYDIHNMVAVYMIITNNIVAKYIAHYDKDNVLLKSNKKSNSKCINVLSDDKLMTKLLQKHELINYQRAVFQSGIKDCEHSGLGIDIYTTFTSPIRRYSDILVHRQLWKVLMKEKILPIDTNVIKHINTCSQLYKQVERHYNLINMIYKINIPISSTYAYITNIDEKGILRLYIESLNIDISHTLINYKFDCVFEILNEEQKIIIKTNKSTIEFSLFQKLTVKIVICKHTIYKILLTIIEPNMQDFFNQRLIL